MTSTSDRVDVGFRSERGPILVALMLCTGLVALDSTIIATAVPSIVGDLGGFSSFPWLFSTYLLAQAVSVPVYGKLADVHGRKPVMLLGIGLFLLGSILCGFAWSMPALIVFRAVQGLGAGAVQPMSITIAGDIYTLAERAKAQGYLASVWGISSVVGPTLGGVFSEYVSWRWIFFVNIPLCLVAAWTLRRRFHESVQRSRHRIDGAGAALLTIGSTMLVLGLLEGGQAWAWASLASVGVLGGGVALLVGFVLVEQRAAEPVLPLWVFQRRLLVVTSLVSAGVGAVVLGLTSYVPTFVQTVLGHGPLVAGFALATLTLGWPIAASQSGKLYLRFGFRATALLGGAIAVVGTALIATVSVATTVWAVAGYCFVVGLGMGLVASPTLIAAQASVGWSERGVVTGTNLFSRSLGSAVGIALFGAIVNLAVRSGETPAAVESGSQHVFLAVAVLAVVMTVAVLALPGRGAPGAPAQAKTAGPGAPSTAETEAVAVAVAVAVPPGGRVGPPAG